jgi:hypothetical protein
MSSKPKCSECGDTGQYCVFNAYNAEDVQKVPCEYCVPKPKSERKLALN